MAYAETSPRCILPRCGPNRKIAALTATTAAASAITGATVNRVMVAPTTAPAHIVSTTL